VNNRLLRTTLAVTSALTASVVIGGTIVFIGSLAYRWVADMSSPALAMACLVGGSLIISGLAVAIGQLFLRQAVHLFPAHPLKTPEQMVVGELIKTLDANPTRFVAVALGVGFALGLSPRLRRMVYRSFIE